MIKSRSRPAPPGSYTCTALFNQSLVEGREKGVFLLRIEDTDPARDTEGSVAAIVEDLRWLGLDWDQGYGVGGAAGLYRQSERGAVYADYYRTLEAEGRAYPRLCTAEELSLTRKAQLAAGTAPRHPGTCARLAKRRAASPADGIELSDVAVRVLPGAGFFDEALEICGRLAGIEGLAGELKTRLGLSGKALFLPLRAALTGRIDGPDLADLIALMPRERVRERVAALIKKP